MPRASELLQAVDVYFRALHARDVELLDSVFVNQLSFFGGPDGW